MFSVVQYNNLVVLILPLDSVLMLSLFAVFELVLSHHRKIETRVFKYKLFVHTHFHLTNNTLNLTQKKILFLGEHFKIKLNMYVYFINGVKNYDGKI